MNRYRFVTLLVLLVGLAFQHPAYATQTPPPARPYIDSAIAWSPNGSQLAVGASDGIWLHDADDLPQMHRLIATSTVYNLSWHPTRNWIAAAAIEEGVFVVNGETGEIVWQVLEQVMLSRVEWSPDGEYLAVIENMPNAEDDVVVFSSSTQEEMFRTKSRFGTRIAWSSDNLLFNVTVHLDDTSCVSEVWDVAQAQLIAEHWCTFVASWTPDGRSLLFQSSEGLSYFEITTGEVNRRFQMERGSPLAFTPDGTRLVVATGLDTYSSTLGLASAVTGEWLIEAPTGPISGFRDLPIAWSPDGTRFAAVSHDGTVYVFDGADLTLLDQCACYAPQPYLVD